MMTIRTIFTGILLLFLVNLFAQQQSTDTVWKTRARQKGLPVPPFPDSLTVAQDGSGDYTTIQAAVNAVRDLSQVRVVIHIKPGTYREKLVIPSWKKNITLLGERGATTVISNNDFSGRDFPGGRDPFGRAKYSTYTSYTVLVQGDDFRAENLTIENTAGRVGQAVALHVEGDRVVILNCRLLGNQDTLYAATGSSRQYYGNCYIEGTTDFIFGEATVVFQSCTIKSLTNSYITAAATTPAQDYGFVFFDCRLVSDSATKVFLGRPWRPSAKTVFIRTDMGAHILPKGWDNWNNTANEATVLYAEYSSSGSGGAKGSRVPWSKQLSSKEVKKYSLKKIFKGGGDWIPES